MSDTDALCELKQKAKQYKDEKEHQKRQSERENRLKEFKQNIDKRFDNNSEYEELCYYYLENKYR